jgi:hypothetical protein
MRMPPLVKVSDSEIEMIELVIAEFSNSFDHARRVGEQVRAGRVTIDQEAPLPDLNVEPVHGNVQYAGEFLSAEQLG